MARKSAKTSEKSGTTPDKDILADALEAFHAAEAAETDNRTAALEDIRFARLADQWPSDIAKQRSIEGRPCLTINRLPSFGRQVINDARQNRPMLKVSPVDSAGDPLVAKVFDGLIRNIQYHGKSAPARDTALEAAVNGGFGYYGIDIDYACDDSFDLDIKYRRFANPFMVYADPMSSEVDSSDWCCAFVIEDLKKSYFEQLYPDTDVVGWNLGPAANGWVTDDTVRRAEYWVRTEGKREIVQLSDGSVISGETYADEEKRAMFDAYGLTIIGARTAKTYKVKQYLITAGDVLERNDWAGSWIPILPVYGEEVNEEGKRHFRGLFRDAKDPQRNFNFWRSAATELVALAPKVPWVGPAGSFNKDPEKWESSNRISHAYLEYTGPEAPKRMQLDPGPATGAISEAMNASDDMKAVMGIYDASLGARSNETSGKAIIARQREGDTGTFHFSDNLNRAVEHEGRVLIDLIPKIYTAPRVIRVMGEDMKQDAITLGQPQPPQAQPPGAGQIGGPPVKLWDLTVGKYDVVAKSGPSFTTRREEAAFQMTEFVRASPPAAPLIMDILARNLDWPEADTIAARLQAALPPHLKGQGPSPQEQQMMQQLQQMQQEMAKMAADMQKKDMDVAKAQMQVEKAQIDGVKTQIDAEIKVAKAEMSAQGATLDLQKTQAVSEVQSVAHEGEKAALEQQSKSVVSEVVPAVQEIGQATDQLQQIVTQLAQKVDAMPEQIAAQRKPRTGRAMKQADGSYIFQEVQ